MKQRAKSRQVPGESKKDWILRLWGELSNPTTRGVSEIVGCRPEYVRVVVRQRAGGGTSEHDRTYLKRKAKELGMPVSTWRYHQDPEWHKAGMARYLERHWGSVKEGVKHFNSINAARRKVRV
jgi:hypothetical protein